MTETPPVAAGEPSGEPPEERQTTPFLVLQFFIFPMAIVAVCVTVFVVFGLISAEGKTPRAYLAEVRTGGGLFNIKRWQAAFALANALEAQKDLAQKDPKLVEEIAALFEESKADDPLVRRYLALALGRLGDKRAAPSLRKALSEATADTDSQTLIYAAWALGALGDEAALPDLVKLASSEDAGVRKSAVHAVGVFPGDAAHAVLTTALADPVEDVRWNAAIALARRGDSAAKPVVLRMLDRTYLASLEVPAPDHKSERLPPDQMEEAILQAVSVAAALPDPQVHAALEALRDKDASPSVREAARAALEVKH
jgi:HEAT repeat protein